MYNLCIKGKNGSQRIVLLQIVEALQHASLVMIDKDYYEIKTLISTKTRDKLKTGLKTNDILKNAQNPINLDTNISILIKKNFVDSIMRIMLDNKCKVNNNFLLCNGTYFFIYNVKTTEPRHVPDPKIFHVDNFQIFTNVAIKVQLQVQNFKPKEANEVTCGYFFKLVSFYYIGNIKMAQLLTSEKQQKQDNN